MSKSCGSGIPATRAANISNSRFSLWLSSVEKIYFVPVFDITADADTKIKSVAYSGSINPVKSAPADFGYHVSEPEGYVLYLYKVTPAAKPRIPVDRKLLNKPVTLRHATGGAEFLSSTISERSVLVDFGEKSGIEILIQTR